MNTRNWSIRSKIIALLLVPLVSLVALWIVAMTLTVGPALNLQAAGTSNDDARKPAEALVTELQRERKLSMVYLAGRTGAGPLGEQRVRTDAAVANFRRLAGGAKMQDVATELARTRISQVFDALEVLRAGRGFIDQREVDGAGTLKLYNGIIDAAYRILLPLAALDDQDLARDSRTLIALGRVRELLAQEDALLSGAFAAGRFADGDPGVLVQTIGARRFLYAQTIPELPDAERVRYQQLTEGKPFVRLLAMEDRLAVQGRGGSAVPVASAEWQSVYNTVFTQLRDLELAAADRLVDRSSSAAVAIFVRLGLATVLGLLAVALSVLMSLWVGRSLITRLTGLRRAALHLAGERLPAVVARLRRGEQVEAEADGPPLQYGADEIGEVARAFTEVQRTAVQSAVEESVLRRGLNEVFLNIARRSQTLLHRQLALLDRMERRATEPEELEDLFRVDHLATRMRRHAEDLVILAGAAPGRGWRKPVSIVDVLRGAASEVEDYARVHTQVVEDAALAGRCVGDIIHLLAELIENATSFSPPQMKVYLAGQLVPNGYAVEIEDRGLGMTPEAIVEANQRLADPPDFDPTNSARLGLFVVAQLGARHGVRVQLRSSPYGGVTAVVLIPTDLVVPGAEPSPARAPSKMHVPSHADTIEVPVLALSGGPDDASRPSVPAQRQAISPPPAPASAAAGSAGPAPSGPVTPESAAPESAAPAEVPPAGSAAVRSAAPAGVATAGPVSAPGGLTDDGLPRRVRQSHLVPGLRQAPAPAADPPPEQASVRSPEETRALMASLQAGTVRGRQDAGTPAGNGGAPAGDTPSTDLGRDA